MLASGLNRTVVPVSFELLVFVEKLSNLPCLNLAVAILPSRRDSTLKYSDKALVAFAPTPFIPPEVL